MPTPEANPPTLTCNPVLRATANPPATPHWPGVLSTPPSPPPPSAAQPVVGSTARHADGWSRRITDKRAVAWATHGVQLLPVRRVPPQLPHMTRRNATLDESKRAWLHNHVAELLEAGAVQKVSSRPAWLSPLFLVPKSGPSQWRLIIDMRGINEYFCGGPSGKTSAHKFKLGGLREVAQLLQPGDWMASADLRSGFHHLSVRQESRQYLGFELAGSYYQYTVLPFGFTGSPYLFTRFLRPVLNVIRSFGCGASLYIDDLFLCDRNPPALRDACQKTDELFYDLGIQRAPEKGCWSPTQHLRLLGLIIHSDTMMFEVPEDKCDRIVQMGTSLLHAARRGHAVSVRSVAAFSGTLEACRMACAPSRAVTAPLSQWVCQHATNIYLDGSGVLPPMLVDLLQRTVADMHTPLWRVRAIRPPSSEVVIHTDASLTAMGAVITGPDVELCNAELAIPWTPEEACRHINELEMLAVVRAAELWLPALRSRSVRFVTDNQVTRACIRKASSASPALAELAQRLWWLCINLDIRIEPPLWIRSADNVTADTLSRVRDPHDWRVRRSAFARVQALLDYQCTMDRFASAENTLCARHNSLTPPSNSAWAATDWQHERNWCCPPLAMISRTLNVLREHRATAIVVLPMWPSVTWWNLKSRMQVATAPMDAADFKPGLSGRVEPWSNKTWRFSAVLLDGTRCCHN